MIPFTLTHWLRADEDARLIILDAVLERMPSGYRSQRDAGHRVGAFPEFIHEETGVLFNVILGGKSWFGMTERRWQRAVAMHAMWNGNEEDGARPLDRRQGGTLEPAREVTIDAALVAASPLLFTQLKKLGLDETRLGSAGFSATQVGQVLSEITRRGWRAPSEAEWEFALRASCGDIGDGVAPSFDALDSRSTMGERLELCRDDFHQTLAGYPEHGSHGAGHEVVRGRTTTYIRGTNSPAWNEALWPGRGRLADVSGHVAFRPWVDLVG